MASDFKTTILFLSRHLESRINRDLTRRNGLGTGKGFAYGLYLGCSCDARLPPFAAFRQTFSARPRARITRARGMVQAPLAPRSAHGRPIIPQLTKRACRLTSRKQKFLRKLS